MIIIVRKLFTTKNGFDTEYCINTWKTQKPQIHSQSKVVLGSDNKSEYFIVFETNLFLP